MATLLVTFLLAHVVISPVPRVFTGWMNLTCANNLSRPTAWFSTHRPEKHLSCGCCRSWCQALLTTRSCATSRQGRISELHEACGQRTSILFCACDYLVCLLCLHSSRDIAPNSSSGRHGSTPPPPRLCVERPVHGWTRLWGFRFCVLTASLEVPFFAYVTPSNHILVYFIGRNSEYPSIFFSDAFVSLVSWMDQSTPFGKLAKRVFFGDSDEFRDERLKLIPKASRAVLTTFAVVYRLFGLPALVFFNS